MSSSDSFLDEVDEVSAELAAALVLLDEPDDVLDCHELRPLLFIQVQT